MYIFEKLEVYTKTLNLVNEIYSLTRNYPKGELFGLTSQIRRAAVSIALNIAEGSSRSKKDFARFLDISRGSAFETVSLLDISFQQGLIENNKRITLKLELEQISKMLSGLKRSLES